MTEETADERMRRLITGQFHKLLPRKFYKTVEVTDKNVICLDGKTVKSPMKNALALPNLALANAVAAEWYAQDKVIDTDTMPLTKLANTALDRATAEREPVLAEIVDYAGSDLVCYGADRPPELKRLQTQHWQPAINWATSTLQADFITTDSLTHVQQAPATLLAVRRYIEVFDAWQLTGIYLVMTLTGSAVLALQLQAGAASSEAVWAAAHVDEDYQISQWGEDSEAKKRRIKRKAEFEGLVQYFELLRS
jgi:chaperone required for assembly of F1-ATPase